MQRDLKVIGRPFGEFIPGGNAARPGQIDKQIELVKQLEIRGKQVVVPEVLTQGISGVDTSVERDRTKRKAERAQRKEKRLGELPE